MKKTLFILVSVVLMVALLGSITASAIFIPSPIANGGINVVRQDFNGESYKALIMNGSSWDDALAGVPDGDIIITPYQDIDSAPDAVDKEFFKQAENELESASSLKDLNSGLSENAVLKDLFDITVTGTYADMIAQGNNLKISFKVGNINGKFKVMVRGANGWVLIDNVKMSDDGIVTMLLSEVGPVAFIVEPDGSDVNKTSDETPIIGYVIVAVCSLTCIVVLLVLRRKRTAE